MRRLSADEKVAVYRESKPIQALADRLVRRFGIPNNGGRYGIMLGDWVFYDHDLEAAILHYGETLG
ncbi:hypothetical protein D3C72_2409680 [compost metagenome]